MRRVIVALLGVALCAGLAAPALAQTQPMQPANGSDHSPPAASGPTTTMDGVISEVHLTGCGLTPQSLAGPAGGCWAVLQITSAPAPVEPQVEQGTVVASINPVTVYVMPDASITTARGTAVPVTDLRAGDEVAITYQQADFGNVATTMTFKARLGTGNYGY